VGLQQFVGYDEIVQIGFNTPFAINNSVSYKVYAINDIKSDSIITTNCGLKEAAFAASDWETRDASKDTTIELKLNFSEYNSETRFIIVARDDATLMTNTYPPVVFEKEKGKTNKVAIVCGCVFGGLGVIAIVIGVVWLVSLKKKEKRIYESIQSA